MGKNWWVERGCYMRIQWSIWCSPVHWYFKSNSWKKLFLKWSPVSRMTFIWNFCFQSPSNSTVVQLILKISSQFSEHQQSYTLLFFISLEKWMLLMCPEEPTWGADSKPPWTTPGITMKLCLMAFLCLWASVLTSSITVSGNGVIKWKKKRTNGLK